MVKKLRFGKVQLVERQGALLLVQFLDDAGELYDWAPKWADVEQIFLKAINIERFNKPESQFLNEFAETAKKVVEGAQRIESCRKVRGIFKKYIDEKLCIDPGTSEQDDYLTPGFEVSIRFLDDWLEKYVEVLVINDIAIHLRGQYEHDDGTRDIYPTKEV